MEGIIPFVCECMRPTSHHNKLLCPTPTLCMWHMSKFCTMINSKCLGELLLRLRNISWSYYPLFKSTLKSFVKHHHSNCLKVLHLILSRFYNCIVIYRDCSINPVFVLLTIKYQILTIPILQQCTFGEGYTVTAFCLKLK